MDDKVVSPREARITRLFLAHLTVQAYNGVEDDFAFGDAKIVQRYDTRSRRTVYAGRFAKPEGGMPACSVLFVVAHESEGLLVGVVSVLNTGSGNFENYVMHEVTSMDSELAQIAQFVALAISGGLDGE